MNITQRRVQQTRLEIEAASARLFDEHGYDNVTVEQIAQAAGISIRTFYRYCPAKEDAITASLVTGSELFIKELRDSADVPLGEALTGAVLSVLEQAGSRMDVLQTVIRVCFRHDTLRARWLGNSWSLNSPLSDLISQRYDLERAQSLVLASAIVASLTVTLELWANGEEHIDVLITDASRGLHMLPRILPDIPRSPMSATSQVSG